MDLVEDAQAMQGELVELRRQIHREPEVGLMLPRTQQRVLSALDELPLSQVAGTGLSSVVAVLRGGRSTDAASCCGLTWTPYRCGNRPASTSPHPAT